jgi:uncharacterized membrane protein YdbT with pleckstrin-like domain
MQPENPFDPTTGQPDPSKVPQNVHNPLAAMRPGETIICNIKRHPIGIITSYAGIGLLLLLIAVVGYAIAPSIFTDYSKSQVYSIVTVVFLVTLVFALLFAVVAHIVYWGNRWIVTSDSVTQVVQNSLFNKQSSQLSMGNLEDVTAEQNGILPHMFNYGVLKAETAGEHSKFRFIYCPNPNFYAQCILQAREAFEQDNYRNPNEQRAYPSEPAQPQGPQLPTPQQ